jgi:hypothetical protein
MEMAFSFSALFKSSRDILVKPKDFWKAKKDNPATPIELWWGYFIPLLILVALSVFVGEFFRRNDFFVEYPVLKALKVIVLFFLQYLISVFFTNELIKTFGGEKDLLSVRRLIVYSMTPLLLVSVITGLFPFLYVMDILGIYSFYIFWLGAKELLVIPDNKQNSYILITIVVNFFVFGFLSLFLSGLLLAYY